MKLQSGSCKRNLAVSLQQKKYRPTKLQKLLVDASCIAMGEYPYKLVSLHGILFDGYPDPMVDIMHSRFFTQDLPNFFNKSLEQLLGFPLPNIQYAGYFAHYNNTSDEDYVVKTGKTFVDEFNHIVTWANMTKLPWWGDDNANRIVGLTDGSFNKPYPKKTDKLHIFRSYACRNFPLVFDKETSVKGIAGYKFKISEEAYNTQLSINAGLKPKNTYHKNFFSNWPCQDGYKAQPSNLSVCAQVDCGNPELYCHGCCSPEIMGNYLMPPGIVDLKCFPGKNEILAIPAVLSPPHFLESPSQVQESIIGLNPDRDTHHSGYFTLQPMTGNAIDVKFRMQVAISVWNDLDISGLNHVRSSVVPALWVEVSADPADYAIDYLYTYTVVIPKVILGVGICFTAIPILVGTAYTVWRYKRRQMMEKVQLESFRRTVNRTSNADLRTF
ncbi:hypothetical protein L596_013542 [Steinernema carpocapsae]|uniref:CD36 family protein n=1 Tax=Steinernema carpocapsae TaxID=34508 RepID=A0A4U5P0Y7_STECR|nr:hypothetical protein L596_013542 [Steinernema carpocapsae]